MGGVCCWCWCYSCWGVPLPMLQAGRQLGTLLAVSCACCSGLCPDGVAPVRVCVKRVCGMIRSGGVEPLCCLKNPGTTWRNSRPTGNAAEILRRNVCGLCVRLCDAPFAAAYVCCCACVQHEPETQLHTRGWHATPSCGQVVGAAGGSGRLLLLGLYMCGCAWVTLGALPT